MLWSDTVFYIAFLGQILLISHYFPNKVLRRMRSVLETYPPTEYPRLYPKPVEYYKMGHLGFRILTRSILVLGLVILFVMIAFVDHRTFADDGFISEAWPAAYGLIQMIPFMILEFTEWSQFRLMRQANSVTKRKAELRPRRLFDFVSPTILGLTVALFLGVIFFDLYLHQFDLNWRHDSMQRVLTMALSNLLMAVMGAWTLYGRKPDPHQTFEDRAKQTSVNLSALLYVSMALSVFFMTQAADDVYGLGFLDAILMSLYFQAIVLLSVGHAHRNLSLENIDFDVYRNGTTASS